MFHANACLTPAGRLRLARLIVDEGWPLRRVAERWNCSVTTARRWEHRYRPLGSAGMVDRSSRPHACARRASTGLERRVVGLRVTRRWGPARIAYRLGMHPSTVHKILTRYPCPPLAWTDPATGVRIKWARAKIHRYVHPAAGDLFHVDIKKLDRIPDGGGHRVLGRAAGKRNRRHGAGYWYLHNAVDDHTRLAYSELLTDETGATAAKFWTRTSAWFIAAGITVHRVLTDNGSCYRSTLFTTALGPETRHAFMRPYRPQTNGKVERFNRTALQEWAYARPYRTETERVAAFDPWLHRTSRSITRRPRARPAWTAHLADEQRALLAKRHTAEQEDLIGRA